MKFLTGRDRKLIWDATGINDLQAGSFIFKTKWWIMKGTNSEIINYYCGERVLKMFDSS